MRDYYRVLKYEKDGDYHVCEDSEGRKHRIDLFVDGGLEGHNNEDIIGKKISLSYIQTFIGIGVDVGLEDE